ncbi:MAG: Holliday junction resolvase RuvX [Candidatus Neomarinimicrobiota bacterium]|nr:MAG: Holliday junction resolvase RuvX [Candidatus Neomarinimicrobiota bacterium]
MGRILGVDHGEKRIGLALSDPTHLIARPYRTLTYQSLAQIQQEFQAIIAEMEVERIVVGLPVNLAGKETKQTERVKSFIRHLDVLGLPVTTVDERLSSVAAVRSLTQQAVKTGHEKARVDATAAALFLQQYLDTVRSR